MNHSSFSPSLWRSWEQWQNLEKLSLENEFSEGASEWPEGFSRRQFLKLAGASMALAGLTHCTRAPMEKIMPYVSAPEGEVPGKPVFYATGMCVAGVYSGLLAENNMGRPTKLDGNPLHPANLGKASALQQAFILSLYSQDRQKKFYHLGKEASSDAFIEKLKQLRTDWAAKQGEGVVLLTELCSSPTLKSQFMALRKKYPRIKHFQYEPLNMLRANRKSSSGAFQPVFHFSKAQVVVSFDADFFNSPLYPVRYAQDFMQKRRDDASSNFTSLFVIEPTPSLTGSWTGKKLIARGKVIPSIALELARRLDSQPSTKQSAEVENFLTKMIATVKAHANSCLFMAGENQSLELHQICHFLNDKFGRETVTYTPAVCEDPTNEQGLEALALLKKRLDNKEVEDLFIFGGNPAYNTPASLGLAKSLQQARHSYRFAVEEDETSALCEWSLPLSHDLESWRDGQAYDGSVTFAQPVIAPLFSGMSLLQVLNILLDSDKSDRKTLQDHWQQSHPRSQEAFDIWWRGLLQEGTGTPFSVAARSPEKINVLPSLPVVPALAEEEVEIIFRADARVWDGRFSNNAWLQELPKPLTLLTWENAALISPDLAKKWHIENGTVLEIKNSLGTIKAPAWILPGQETRSVTLSFGYGRKSPREESVGHNLGYNAYQIWDSDFSVGTVAVTKEKIQLATTQTHSSMAGQDLVKTMKPGEILPASEPKDSLYPEDPNKFYSLEAWAMVIDLDSCTGCSACTVACQSENNIPVVGKEGVLRGREMTWIRVDRYYADNPQQPRTYFQPVPCMHCEKAPCEPVCPVGATLHSTDGLNQMVYNRCIGTRYCSNNCPYKVRRFNYLSYNNHIDDLQRLQKNPQVSVRTRGVMEKCTYCVQKINMARIEAQKDQRPLRDGDIQTACQATCPTKAITFGNMRDRQSEVHRLRQSSRHYTLLEELGTRPRTTYLAKIEEDRS